MNNDDDYNSSGKDVRKGKWTVEEENYSNKIIAMFNQGLLFIPAGTTLRSYLSEKLSCDPMRITKKFAGASCIGKQVFHPCEHTEANNQLRKEGMAELQQLEFAFLHRLRSKSAAVAQLVEKFVPSQSPGGGRGVKNKHNPSLSLSSSATLEKSNSLNMSNDQERLRTMSSESGSYIVVKEEGAGGESHGFQKNKRIMSAPDLTLLLHNEGLKGSDSSTKLSELAYSPGGGSFLLGSMPPGSRKTSTPRSRVRTGSGAKMSKELGDFSGGGIAQQGSHHNSLRMAKKYHSQMDLAHYEKLASDDMAAGNLFLNFMQTLGDKYHTNTSAYMSNLTSKSPSVDQLNLLSQVSAAATATITHHTVTAAAATHSGNAEAFMTIEDVISSTVTQDFSTFSVSDVKVPSPFNTNSNVISATNTSSRCVSVLSSHSPLLLSNPDLVSLNPILIAANNKDGLATSHTSVQGIEHLDRAAFDFHNKTTAVLGSSSGNSNGVLESAPIFVDQSQSNSSTVESASGFEDSNFF